MWNFVVEVKAVKKLYHQTHNPDFLLEKLECQFPFWLFFFLASGIWQGRSVFQCLASALLPNPSCSDLCRSLALICWLLMLLSPLICPTFGKALIAMETEILMDSEGITNGEIVGRRDRKLVFLEDSVSSVSSRMLLGINKCRCVRLCVWERGGGR